MLRAVTILIAASMALSGHAAAAEEVSLTYAAIQSELDADQDWIGRLCGDIDALESKCFAQRATLDQIGLDASRSSSISGSITYRFESIGGSRAGVKQTVLLDLDLRQQISPGVSIEMSLGNRLRGYDAIAGRSGGSKLEFNKLCIHITE